MRYLTAHPEDAPWSERKAPRLVRRSAPRRWLGRLCIAVGVALALGGGGFAAHRAGIDGRLADSLSSRLLALSADAGLAITDIEVEGRHRASPDSVLAALGAQRGTPILAVSPAEAKARLEAMPWVRSASVERLLPDTLHVRIVERRPLAVWQRNGKFNLIDQEGKVLPTDRLGEFFGLLVLVGEDAPKEGAALLDMLASEPELASRVAAAVRVGGRRWNLHMDNGIDVELPENDPAAAWHDLARLERTDEILQRDLRRVDLRLPDRLVVQTPPEPPKMPPKKKPAPGKST
jgi:cell division protein FtsQ